MYCENCFYEFEEDNHKPIFIDSLGSVFCDEQCYLDSLEYRDVENELELGVRK